MSILKKYKATLFFILIFSILWISESSFSYLNETDLIASSDKKAEVLLSKMTLEEKIGQMNQYNGFWDFTGPSPKGGDAEKKYQDLKNGFVGSMLNVRGVKDVLAVQKIAVEETRLGIPLIIGFDVIHGYKTISPIPIAEAASWDLEAIQKSAEMAALESSAAGINWTFAPMVDISRDARWGRVMEGAGEDPFLGSKIATARVKGFQGENLSSNYTIAACAKHFAAYGFSEGGRDYNTVDLGTSTLYNMVFPPFIAAKDAGVKTFMNSFNELNGIPATGNEYLQREVLKEQWNFDGFVVSDWDSISEMIAHGYTKDESHAAEIALNAGSDMDMESYIYLAHLKNLVDEDKVELALIDDAVKRILKVKFELGLFDDPYKYCDLKREEEITGSKEINDAALDIAKKSIVLLKNEGNLLPLKKEGQHIAIIGALASDKTSPLGNWRLAADDDSAISVLEGMSKYKGNSISYSKGADLTIGKTGFVTQLKINTIDKSGFKEAITIAKKADIVLMILGELMGQDHAPIIKAVKDHFDSNLGRMKESGTRIFEFFKNTPRKKFVIVCDREFAPVATRFTQQLQENSKLEGFINILPESNHNVIESYTDRLDTNFIMLYSTQNPRVEARFDFLISHLELENNKVLPLQIPEYTVQSVFDLIYRLDWVSVLLANELGSDLMNVPIIMNLKGFLSDLEMVEEE